MKKLFLALLIFSFAFSVSAGPVQSKLPEKAKIEKTVFKIDSEIVISLKSEEKLVIAGLPKQKELPCESESNYNIKDISEADYIADISRTHSKYFLVIS